VLAFIDFTLLTVFANLLSALMAMSGIVLYGHLHPAGTHRSKHCYRWLSWGIPALVGWAAVTLVVL